MRGVLSVANVLGRLLMVFGLTYALPIICALVYRDGTLATFMVSLAACLAAGGALTLSTRRFQTELKPRDGFILVSLAWTLISAIATVPLMLHEQLSFTDAFFETMSGMTTTGATVMVGLDSVAPAINLWRHVLNWVALGYLSGTHPGLHPESVAGRHDCVRGHLPRLRRPESGRFLDP